MQKLHYTIQINAPVQKVWHTMLDDKTYRDWTRTFAEGSHYVGSWNEGSDIRFLAPDETGALGGMISKIAENQPYEFISIKHIGMVQNGVDDVSSEKVLSWVGALENYTFSEVDGVTTLTVDLDAGDEWTDMMEEMWPKALQRLKELSEQN